MSAPVIDRVRQVISTLRRSGRVIYQMRLSPIAASMAAASLISVSYTHLTQQRARKLAELPEICILCGHYEGVDERVLEALVDEQISLGDFVLTGGELPALALVDCISRMVPGVLSEDCLLYTSERTSAPQVR